MESKEKVEVKLLDGKEETAPKVKAYKRRWVILVIFMVYSCINSFQWIEYSSITHIVVKYYKVSTLAVDWTSIIYMALYPIFVVPASYVIDKKGLRTAGLIGCLGTAIGTGIKVLSIRSDLFFIVLLGQAIVSASQVVIVCLPPKIAATWFKPSEISRACSLGVVGTQLGVAIGYFLPPILVQDSDNLQEIGSALKLLCWLLAGSMVPVTIAVLVYFPNQPPLPPSAAQASLRDNKDNLQAKVFFKSLGSLFLNKPFVVHMVAYSLNIGVTSAIGTLLNQFILQYFEGASEDSGRIGFVMVITGLVGMLAFGIILDKTHKYKEMTFLIYLLCTFSVIALMYSLEWKSLWLTYAAGAVYGLFTSAYMPVGFEFAMELTYPSEEGTTTGILLAMTQLVGVIFAVGASYTNRLVGCFWTLVSQAVFLFIGTIITGFIPNTLLRQEAFRQDGNNLGRKLSHHGSRLVYIQ